MKKLIKKIFKSKRNIIIASSVLLVIIIGVIILVCYNRKSEIDTTYILAKLEKSSELTTAKLTYDGYSWYKDTGIALINRGDFMMVYTATARAGIDISKVKITTDYITKTIIISLPKAEILDIKVDPGSIKYYDEKFALFNFDKKEDANDAQKKAEEKARTDLENFGILKSANEQAEVLIKGLIQDIIPKGYTLKVKQQK